MKQYHQTPTQESQDPIVSEKIELFIQQSENVTLPAIVFEYLSKDNTDFEANDLRNFYEQFGEIEDFELNGKVSVVMFKLFFAANTCREFLQNEHNFKDNMKKDFMVRWFNLNEDSELIPEELRCKYEQISQKNSVNLKQNILSISLNNMNNNMMRNGNNMINNNMNLNNNYNIQNHYIQPNLMNNMNINNMNINNMNINNMNMINYNTPMNIQNFYMNNMIPNPQNIMNNSYNQNINNYNHQNNEEKNYGKYTCKFEILIPNDKEFQIARRLIGGKGCNMKKIIDECKLLDPYSNDVVKLRLRGKGSGYKEGPQNKESDEPLHLCISAKNKEGMEKASECVNDLLNKIYEDYKKHCVKNGIKPISKIANRIVGGNTVHNKGINNNMFH
jgi:hypothetical protein